MLRVVLKLAEEQSDIPCHQVLFPIVSANGRVKASGEKKEVLWLKDGAGTWQTQVVLLLRNSHAD